MPVESQPAAPRPAGGAFVAVGGLALGGAVLLHTRVVLGLADVVFFFIPSIASS